MNWLKRLLGGSQKTEPLNTPPVNSRITYPKKRGKTPEQFSADLAAYQKAMREKFRTTAQFDQKRAERAGAKTYIWRSSGDEDVCPDCAKHDGKKYSWKKPPKNGHPGTSDCCPGGYCRCFAEPVLPGF